MIEHQDLVTHLSREKTHLRLVPALWSSINTDILQLVQSDGKWKSFRYLNDDGTLNQIGINSINRKKGGIYIYYISPEIIPERQRILMYIGRAHITDSENLRDRVRSYYWYYCNDDTKRPMIRQLFVNWGKYIFCSFFELEDNHIIDSVEAELINTLLPPCNSKIPDVTIARAVKAADF